MSAKKVHKNDLINTHLTLVLLSKLIIKDYTLFNEYLELDISPTDEHKTMYNHLVAINTLCKIILNYITNDYGDLYE